MKQSLTNKIKEYHFEFRHVTVLFIILFSFQLIVSFINKSSIKNFLDTTQDWYQKESAEEIANLTATVIELSIESVDAKIKIPPAQENKVIQSLDIIFSQQQLTHNIDRLFIIMENEGKTFSINDGRTLYSVVIGSDRSLLSTEIDKNVEALYKSIEGELESTERIKTVVRDKQTFHVFVPFVVRGEFIGAIYMEISPDFSSISNQVISSYDETSVIYLSLITLGLLAMYFISSYTVKERDETQKLLFDEHERNLKKQINYENELIFTKRIYHTHHKAEKVMGFIKEDLRMLELDNIDEIKYRVAKYSNFVSRVIYDMKWFDPPIQTIRNQMFRTDLNEVVRFIVGNIFQRVTTTTDAYRIECKLEQNLPVVNVNEFVVWEIIEPLIQNSIDHGSEDKLVVTVETRHDPEKKCSILSVTDNGKGIDGSLLKLNENGIKYLFVENTTTKSQGLRNSGYGCYIAWEMTKRCGWELDAQNLPEKGCRFTITIKH
ncbi:MAG: sensor histidine kinase [Ignavibacteriales bacterium]|jgi:signal transduction histidine kinase|nr:sensor histidine kinase [Ignavibacteriales bacterium]